MNLSSEQHFLVLAYFLLLLTAGTWTDVIVRGINCKFHKQYCNPAFCQLSNSRGKSKYLSFNCNVVELVPMAWIEFNLFRQENGVYSSYFKVKQNMCEMTKLNIYNQFFNRLVNTNIEKLKEIQCPVKGNVTVEKIPLSLYMTQSFLPKSDYKMNFVITNEKVVMLNMNITFSITAKQF